MKQAPASLLLCLAIGNVLGAGVAVEVDEQFNVSVRGTVHAIVATPQKLIIGGEFDQVNGMVHGNLASLDTNGDVDGEFDVASDGAVLSLAAAPDGSIYAGGAFNVPSPHIFKLSAGGAVDGGLMVGSSVSSRIDCLAVGISGDVAFGGPFRRIDGATAYYVGRLTGAGTIDASFNSPFEQTPALEAGADAIAVQADGKTLVGGNFNTPNGGARFVRLNADGSLDETFSEDHGAMLYPKAIVVQSDGRILVAGVATSSGDGFVRRLNDDRSVDSSFQEARFPGCVETIVVADDGSVVVGGSFPGGLARLNPDGSKDDVWTISTDGVVKAIALQADGVVVGGAFSKVGDLERKSLARLLLRSPQQAFATNANGRFVARLRGEEGKYYAIEASSDLLNWASMGTVVATSAGVEVSDDASGGRRHRFFRARLMQ